MPDGNSAESAGKSLHEPAPSAPTPEADAPIAQPQRRSSLKGGHCGCGSPAVRLSF